MIKNEILNSIMKFMCKVWKKRGIRIFTYAVLFRCMIYLVSVCIMAIMGSYQEGITFSDFLEAWKRWDSAHYLRIAEEGYSGAVENGQHLFLVFFPLYPWLIRTLHLLISDYRLSGIIISVVCYGIGNVYLDKIMRIEYGKEDAENAAAALAVFPFSFFFGAIMTESLYFAIMAAFFYYLRKHRFGDAALAGFLACLTKMQGMLLSFAVVGELFYSYRGFTLLKERQWKRFFNKIILQGMKCVPMLLGTLLYLAVNYFVEGDPFRFMYYQKSNWSNALCPIWETFAYIKRYASEGWYTSIGMSLWIPELILFFVYIASFAYGIVKKMRPSYLAYLLSYFLLTYSSTWLISGGRYVLSAMPVFMLCGKFLTEHKKTKAVLLPLSFALMIVYMTGYYLWKQIM